MSRLVDIPRSYASHLTLCASFDALIWGCQLDVFGASDRFTVVIMCTYCPGECVASVLRLSDIAQASRTFGQRLGGGVVGWCEGAG